MLRRRTHVVALAVVAVAFALLPTWTGPAPGDFSTDLDRISILPSASTDTRPVAVVTGSSSVRLWTDAQSWLPEYRVVNTGFGGSTAADLLAHLDEVVLRFDPDVVYIAEGDNDIATGVAPEQVLRRTAAVLDRLRQHSPAVGVVLVAAKPSVLRWHLRHDYERLNDGLADVAANRPRVYFADVWRTLVGPSGRLSAALYQPDGLHLNEVGHALWAGTVTDPCLLESACRSGAPTVPPPGAR